MSAMLSITGEMQNKIAGVLSQYPVSKAAVFGSFARSEASEQSDIDLLVEFYRPVGIRFFELKQDIEDTLGRPVDLIRYSDMMRSNRAQDIFKEARTIYVNKENQYA